MTDSIDYYRACYFVCFIITIVCYKAYFLAEQNWIKYGVLGLAIFSIGLSIGMFWFEGLLEQGKKDYEGKTNEGGKSSKSKKKNN